MTPSRIDPTRPVGEMAADMAGAARLFQQAGIDFCCGGQRTLEAACAAHGRDLDPMLARLEAARVSPAPAPDAHWRREPLGVLIAHLVEKHHGYVRAEIPRIEDGMEKVLRAHGDRHPELLAVRHGFAGMAAEMLQHMAQEEQILAALEAAAAASPIRPGSLGIPIKMMVQEHEHTGHDLNAMRQASGDYAIPPDGCSTYHALYQALAAFEADMRQHVHLENNILFPRALALDAHAA